MVRNETDPVFRGVAMNTLGMIGPDAKAAIPAIKTALQDYQEQEEAALAEVQKAEAKQDVKAARGFKVAAQMAKSPVASARTALRKIDP